MATWWTNLVDRIWENLIPEESVTRRRSAVPDVVSAVDRARRDWEAARAYFDSVSDPDLVDHAIYAVEAAERKYVYLLRRAEEMGYKAPEEDLKRLFQSSAP